VTYKIEVIMLRKNRTAERFQVDPDHLYFKRRGHLYCMPKEAVNTRVFEDQKNNPHAELIYVEGDPIPQTTAKMQSGTDFLENLVIENAIQSTAKPKGFFLEILGDYLKSPGKILLLAFVVIIIGAFASGLVKF
jgi:hypothetical protein